MNEVFTWCKMIFGGICSICTFLWGGADLLMVTLLCLIVIDYISGVLGAWVQGKLNSAVGYRGIAKKVGILIVVALGYIVGRSIGMEDVRSIVIGFYIANEGLSILENLGKIGLQYPQAIQRVLEQLLDKNNSKEE